MRKEICKLCQKTFEVYNSRPPATYCSIACKKADYKSWHAISNKTYILTKKEVTKKIRFKWINATEDEKIIRLRKIFERSVIKRDGCWDWNKKEHHSGYCYMNYDGKNIGIHRISWMLYNGMIPNDMSVLHKCDNRKCSNPQHLFLGTNKDNIIDMDKKGRRNPVKGEAHVNSKLTIEKVKKIKELLNLGVPISRISKDYSMSATAISAIKAGRTWKYVI